MAKLKLQVLAPGKRFVGFNADRSKRFVDFTPEYVKAAYERNAALVDAGIPVPVCWGHRDDAKPGKLSRDDLVTAREKGTAGFVDRYELDLSSNRVFATVDVPDESDAKRAEILKFCSPEIDEFTDGSGKDWGEVFTHVALTPRPRQHGELVPTTRLSLTYAGPIRLAIDQEGNDMAEEKKGDEKPEKKGDGEGDDAGSEIKDLIEALKSIGLTIPEEVTDIPGLIIAVKAGGGEGGEEDDGYEDDGNPPENVGEAGSPSVQMSLAEKKSTERAEKVCRKELENRIVRLVKSGRVTPPIAEGLKTRLTGVRLSFDKEGELKSNKVLAEIEAYERLPQGNSWARRGSRRLRLSADEVNEVQPPEDLRGKKSDKEVMDAWDAT